MEENLNERVCIKHTRIANNQFDVYITNEIGDPSSYTDLCHALRMAGEGDVFNIFLNTPGGRLDSGIQILNAIAGTRAKVCTVLDGVAHSMGSFLLLAGDNIIILPHGQVLLHNFSSLYYGKASDSANQLNADRAHFERLCREYYKNFLTKKELDDLLDGKDFWLSSEEICERLEKRK